MFKKSTSTFRVCENKSTPIQWAGKMFHGGQWVTPPPKAKPVIYSTKSLSRIENFETYDNNYNRECKKLWTKLVIEIGQGRSVKSLNEWEKMLMKKFGKLKYEKA